MQEIKSKTNTKILTKTNTKIHISLKAISLYIFLTNIQKINCAVEPNNKIGLPIPLYDWLLSFLAGPIRYLIFIALLAAILGFCVYPDNKYFLFQTCTMITAGQTLFIMHFTGKFLYKLGAIVALLSCLAYGGILGFLSLKSEFIRKLGLLSVGGYIIGYWINGFFSISYFVVAFGTLAACMVGSVFLDKFLGLERAIKIGRGIFIGHLTFYLLDITIFPACIIQTIHGIALDYIIPFMDKIFCLVWAFLVLGGVYYELNRANVKAKIENRNLTPIEKNEGLGVSVDEEYKGAVEPTSSMV